MTYQLPPLPWLRAFEAAARHGSFTAAATEINLTQAAVSHQVRSLERHLGFALFERLPRSLRLTDMGGAYLPSIRKAFDDLSASTAGLFGSLGEQSLTVRAPVSYAVLWLAPRIRSFTQAYPDIDIRLCSAIWADALADETTDIEIRFGDGLWPGFQIELIRNEGSIPLCAPEFGTGRAFTSYLAGRQNSPLIHVTGHENLWRRLMNEAGLPEPDMGGGIMADTSLAALELAASGIGPVVMLRSFGEQALAAGRLIQPLDIELPLDQSHYLLLPEGVSRLKPEAVLFREWLLDEARSTPLGQLSSGTSCRVRG